MVQHSQINKHATPYKQKKIQESPNRLRSWENNSIHNSIKISKILKINQDAKKLCNENCKSLKKEIVKDNRKWKNFLFS
jgi:hypothetical protein